MKKTKRIVYMGVYVSLALALDIVKEYLVFLNMPSGGSVNIALIPIFIASLHLGIKSGAEVGFLWWLSSSLIGLNPYYISPIQYLLDYIIPSIIPCLSAIFKKRKTIYIETGILISMIIRTASIVISGAIYWPEGGASGSLAAWTFSLSYSLPYCIITTLMLMTIVPIIYNRYIQNVIR